MYDSPIIKILTDFTIDPVNESGKKLDEAIANDLLTITKKYQILVDEKGLIDALKQDQTRYTEAYNRGYRAAEEKWRHKLNVLLGNEDEDEDG